MSETEHSPATQLARPTDTPGWVRGLELALMACGAGLLVFVLFQLVWFSFGTDQAIIAVIADGLLQGELPYADRWSMRTPGIYPFYAAAQLLFGKNMVAIRLLEASALLSLFVAFPILSRRFTGGALPGFVGALLATLTHVQLGYWNTGQSDSFGGVVLAWALVLVTWRPDSRRRQLAAWIASGALFALAGMLRPPLGGGFVLCLALVVWERRRAQGGWRQGLAGRGGPLEPILAFGLGGALIVAATLLPFIVSGAVSDLIWTYRDVVPGYAALNSQDRDVLPGLYRVVRDLLFRFSPYFFPGLALWALLPPLGRRERTGVFYLLAAIVPQLVGIVLQGKFFEHHSGGMIHLFALWSAWGYAKLWQRIRHRPLWVALFLIAVIAVHDAMRPKLWDHSGQRWHAFLNPEERTEILDKLHNHRHHKAINIRQASRWIERKTAPDARILVWGPQAAIYFHADRQPASRFITNFPLRFPWAAGRAKFILKQEIEATPPAVIVVSQDDAWVWATGNKLDSAATLARIPWLKALLQTRYRRAKKFGRLTVYRLWLEGEQRPRRRIKKRGGQQRRKQKPGARAAPKAGGPRRGATSAVGADAKILEGDGVAGFFAVDQESKGRFTGDGDGESHQVASQRIVADIVAGIRRHAVGAIPDHFGVGGSEPGVKAGQGLSRAVIRDDPSRDAVVEGVDHQVAAAQQLLDVAGVEAAHHGLGIGTDGAIERVGQDPRLARADVGPLPGLGLEIALLDPVVVDQAQAADAGAGQALGDVGAQGTGAAEGDPRQLQDLHGFGATVELFMEKEGHFKKPRARRSRPLRPETGGRSRGHGRRGRCRRRARSGRSWR